MDSSRLCVALHRMRFNVETATPCRGAGFCDQYLYLKKVTFGMDALLKEKNDSTIIRN